MSRRRSRHRPREFPGPSVDIRVGSASSRNEDKYLYLRVTGHEDDYGRFDGLLRRAVADNPRWPLVIVVNGFQPWVDDILAGCIDDMYSNRQKFHQEVVCTNMTSFPENTYKRQQKQQYLPWTFILENINFPDVYHWSFQQQPSSHFTKPLPVGDYTFRVGVWTCAQFAYKADHTIPVTIIYTVPSNILNNHEPDEIITRRLFQYLYAKADFNVRRLDEEWVACWFLWLFEMLTAWDNVTRELDFYVIEATDESEKSRLPVRQRTRAIHRQIDKIYDLLSYLSLHTRFVKKLLRQKPEAQTASGAADSQLGEDDGRSHASTIDRGTEPVWSELEDIRDDLEQVASELATLKDRFSNLTDLEFNLSNAKQSDESKFLSGIATLFLPVSYLASIWGITTITLAPIQYLYAAIAALAASLTVIYLYPKILKAYQTTRYPETETWLTMKPEYFIMLGRELPYSEESMNYVNTTTIKNEREAESGGNRSRRRWDSKD